MFASHEASYFIRLNLVLLTNDSGFKSVAEDDFVAVSEKCDFSVRGNQRGWRVNWQLKTIRSSLVGGQRTWALSQNPTWIALDLIGEFLSDCDTENRGSNLRSDRSCSGSCGEVNVSVASQLTANNWAWCSQARVHSVSEENCIWQRNSSSTRANWSSSQNCWHESENNEKLEHFSDFFLGG